MLGAETAKTIGEQQYGLGAKASGIFVIVRLKVTSKRDQSATLTNDVIQLEGSGVKYGPDNDGTVAAIGAGEDPLFLKDIGPDVNRYEQGRIRCPKALSQKAPRSALQRAWPRIHPRLHHQAPDRGVSWRLGHSKA